MIGCHGSASDRPAHRMVGSCDRVGSPDRQRSPDLVRIFSMSNLSCFPTQAQVDRQWKGLQGLERLQVDELRKVVCCVSQVQKDLFIFAGLCLCGPHVYPMRSCHQTGGRSTPVARVAPAIADSQTMDLSGTARAVPPNDRPRYR